MDTVAIYALIDPRTECLRYVGKTKRPLQARLKRHVYDAPKQDHRRTHRGCWLLQLKRQGLRPRIRLIQRVPSSQWPEAERYWVAFFREAGCPLTNSCAGGKGSEGHIVSPELRAQISARHKGKTLSSSHKAAISAAAKQKWADWRAKGKSMPQEQRETLSRQAKGRRHSKETRELLSSQRKGKPKSLEHREKIRQALKGEPKSPEHRAKMLKTLEKINKERK